MQYSPWCALQTCSYRLTYSTQSSEQGKDLPKIQANFLVFVCLFVKPGTVPGFYFIYPWAGIERHSSARPFLIHDYAMNQGTQSSDREIVSNLGDPLWYLPDGVEQFYICTYSVFKWKFKGD